MDSGTRTFLIICAVAIGVAIVLAVVIVVLLLVLLSPRVAFESYTAELRYDYGMGHYAIERATVFSDEKWSFQQAYNNVFYTNVFSNEYHNYYGMCQVIGDHTNCYQMTGSRYGGFYVTRFYSKEGSGIDCPSISDPVLPGSQKRSLSKCDFYEYEDSEILSQVWVESDNEYPVRVHEIDYDSYGKVAAEITLDYTSFSDEEPTDYSLINPPSGVTFYDFRKDGVDYDNSALSKITRFFGRNGNNVKSNDDENDDAHVSSTASAFIRRLKKEKRIREKFNLPVFGFAGPGIGPTPENMKARDDTPIPTSFDARAHWPLCASVIGTITDQKSCGSCWAMSTAGVLSDRACINSTSLIHYSPQYMVNCYKEQLGCEGGFVSYVWSSIIDHGTVSESCLPFKAIQEECSAYCANGELITENMKIRPKRFYSPWGPTDSERVEAIQREIMTNGPVATAFLVFEQFQYLNHKVYSRTSTDEFVGGHMVRIIGWGQTASEKYWLVANSWGEDWDELGYFKIRRGTNECNIESTVVAGLFD